MALSKVQDTQYGITVENAYHRVCSVAIANKQTLSFLVEIFANVERVPISSQIHTCAYDLDGPNPIKQAYLHLKTLPEFSDAVDC